MDIYRRDVQLGKTHRATKVIYSDPEPNGHSSSPEISADGGKVVFRSYASNIFKTTTDTNGLPDAYLLQDWQLYDSTRVSSIHVQSEDDSERAVGTVEEAPALSADGLTVAFYNRAATLGGSPTRTIVSVHKDPGNGVCLTFTQPISPPFNEAGEQANPCEDKENDPIHHVATDKNSLSTARGGPVDAEV